MICDDRHIASGGGGEGPVATGTLGPVLRSHWLAGPGVLARYWSAGHVTGAACTVDWGEGRPGGGDTVGECVLLDTGAHCNQVWICHTVDNVDIYGRCLLEC